MHVLALVAPGLARIEDRAATGIARAFVAASSLLPAKESALLHEAAHRRVGRHATEPGLEHRERDEVVGVQLIAPARMLAVLHDHHRDQHRGQRPALTRVLADAPAQRTDGVGASRRATRNMKPALDRREGEGHLRPRDRVLPGPRGQRFERGTQFALSGRGREQRAHDRKSQVRPPLVPSVRVLRHPVVLPRRRSRRRARRRRLFDRACGR